MGNIISSTNGNTLLQKKSDLKMVVDMVHKHVFGDKKYTDYQLLLDRNNMWND